MASKVIQTIDIKPKNLIPYVNEQGWGITWAIYGCNWLNTVKRFKILSNRRKVLAKFILAELKEHKKIQIFVKDYKNIVPHIYPIRIKNLKSRIKLINTLKKKKIEIGYHYFPNHRLNFYKKKNIKLKNTNKLFPELLTLPMHPDISKKEAYYIVNTLLKLYLVFDKS